MQRLARSVVDGQMGVRFSSPTLMSKDNEYLIVSTDGFVGQLFRASQKYIEKGQKVPQTPQERGLIGSVSVIKTTIKSSTGKLYGVIARDSVKKERVEVALIQPTNTEDYYQFISSRNLNISTTELPPIKFALATLLQALTLENQEQSPVDKFKEIMLRESLFPFQNEQEAFNRLEQRSREGLPFKMGCFACLNTKCSNRGGLPVFYLGQNENRLTSPKLMRRTQQLVSQLDRTSVPYSIDILVADTDIYDVNGDWLDKRDQSMDIYNYQQMLLPKFSRVSPRFDCKLWSDVQASYEDQYRRDFGNVYNQYKGSNDDEVLINIEKRLRSLIDQGVPDSRQLRDICRITTERNFALYAAQGPIIDAEYDCLIMADPEPLRLGTKQSLLVPDLSIWYPYTG